jgi:N-acetyl-beta-hexosaminidase
VVSPTGGAFYSAEELRGLAAYAEGRFVTVVPEVDTPGTRPRWCGCAAS